MTHIQFLRIGEVLERLKISRSKLYAMIKNNKFPPPTKIGNTAVWEEEAVSNWQKDIIGANHGR